MGHIESILKNQHPFLIGHKNEAGSTSNQIGNRSEDFKEMFIELKMISDLLGGTEAMRNASTQYLPMWEAESTVDYGIRLDRSFLFDGLRKNLRMLVAKPFSRPVQFSDYSDIFLERFKDIDLLHTSFSIFLRNLFWSMLGDGQTFILIDMPTTKNKDGSSIFKNQAEEKLADLRPYMCRIDARDILGVKTFRNGVKEDVAEVRIQERIQVDHGEYDIKIVKRVRLFRVDGSWELWEEISKSNSNRGAFFDEGITYKLIEEGMLSIPIIPIVPIYANRKGLYLAESVLKDVAWKNIEAWQDASCQNNALSFARVPMLSIMGYNSSTDAQVVIAPNSSIQIRDANAKIQYIEGSGTSILAGERNGLRIKKEMDDLGVRLMQSVTFKTATESVMDSADEDSETKSHVEVLERGGEAATKVMAMFDGIPIKKNIGKIKIFKEFDLIANRDKDMVVLGDQQRRNVISKDLEIEESKRRNIISEDVNTEEIINKAEQESLEESKKLNG